MPYYPTFPLMAQVKPAFWQRGIRHLDELIPCHLIE